MLIEFIIQNFLSFNQEQKISMIPGKVRGKSQHLIKNNKIKLLSFSAVYGANAAGKSNLVKALDFSREIIVDTLPKGHNVMYNRTNEINKELPSKFEFKINLKSGLFRYGYEMILSTSSIKSEWLYSMDKETDILIFSRNIVNDSYDFGKYLSKESARKRAETYLKDIKTQDNVLFLSEINRNKMSLYKEEPELKVFKEIYDWFEDGLDINFPNRVFSDYSYFMTKSNSEELCETIKSFATGITNFSIVDIKQDELREFIPKKLLEDIKEKLDKGIIEAKKNNGKIEDVGLLLRGDEAFFIFEVDSNENIIAKTIKFEHGIHGIFDISEESDGTRRLLELIEILFADNNNKTYVIDELDRCLHPLLTYKFIERYLNSIQKRNIQLIVTTHESRLLDLDLLRRDEIWFANKEDNGNTDIYSLEDYNERFDKKIDKAYLGGRYHAVPRFDEV